MRISLLVEDSVLWVVTRELRSSSSGEAGADGTDAFDLGLELVAGRDRNHGTERAREYEIACPERLSDGSQFAGEPYRRVEWVAQARRTASRGNRFLAALCRHGGKL